MFPRSPASLAALAVAACLGTAHACTTVIAGKGATVDGSTMATHSDDGSYGADSRLLLTPAADHAPGSMRPVYYDTEDFPHDPSPGQKPIGYIPEANHTFARYSCTYGIMNERQVGMGETTCSGVFGAKAVGNGGKALMSIDSLSRVGLERCPTARCAVQVMGDLAVRYGFYGPGSFEGSSESLMVIDPHEAFIFHILPDHTGTSAIWVAQRVDDDSVGVVANMFTIREVNLTDSFHFLGSANMHDIAQNIIKAWTPADGLLDFTKVFSDGEYAHLFYSGRRMWGAYHLLAPSLGLPDNYTDLKFEHVYPAFVKPDKKVSRNDIFKVHRYYYEGTPHDMTKGIAAGPWGNPDRWNGGSGKVQGNWERSIGLFRTSHTHLVQARSWLPDTQGGLVWYAPHSAPSSCFVPFCAGCTAVAEGYTIANPNVLNRSSAYWAHRYVFNIMHIKYSYMRGIVNETALAAEAKSGQLVDRLDKLVVEAGPASPNARVSAVTAGKLTDAYIANAEEVIATWWTLPDLLVTKFADGWLDDGDYIPYSNAWLMESQFADGPPDIPCPPCPCVPSTSPTCSSCCGKHAPGKAAAAPPAEAAAGPEPGVSAAPQGAGLAAAAEPCDLRSCVQECFATQQSFRRCVGACDRRCAAD